jgi:hypothetical protein
MSNNTLKVKFDSINKTYDFFYKASDEISYIDQQKRFLEGITDIENVNLHHLYNTDTGLFILNNSELGTGKFI